jgi:hypothetical protein
MSNSIAILFIKVSASKIIYARNIDMIDVNRIIISEEQMQRRSRLKGSNASFHFTAPFRHTEQGAGLVKSSDLLAQVVNQRG